MCRRSAGESVAASVGQPGQTVSSRPSKPRPAQWATMVSSGVFWVLQVLYDRLIPTLALTFLYPGLALVGHGACRVALPRRDVLDPPKAQRRPILVDGDLAHRLETEPPERRPARVAIEVATIALRRPLWIGEPDERV